MNGNKFSMINVNRDNVPLPWFATPSFIHSFNFSFVSVIDSTGVTTLRYHSRTQRHVEIGFWQPAVAPPTAWQCLVGFDSVRLEASVLFPSRFGSSFGGPIGQYVLAHQSTASIRHNSNNVYIQAACFVYSGVGDSGGQEAKQPRCRSTKGTGNDERSDNCESEHRYT